MDVDNATFENSVDRAPLFNLIEALLARGANPNVRTKEVLPSGARCFVSQAHCHGWTSPVDTFSDVGVVGRSAGHASSPRTRSRSQIPTIGGTTALMAAAGVNWVVAQTYDEGPKALLEAVKLCWELGMDVNAVNSMGLTALHGGQPWIGRHHSVPCG